MSAPTLAAHRRAELDAALLAMLQTVVARAPLFDELRRRGLADDLVQETMIAIGRRLDGDGLDDPFAYARRVVENLARRAYTRARPEDAVPLEELDGAGAGVDPAEVIERRFELGEVLDMVRAVTEVVEDLDAVDLELVRAELARDDQQRVADRLGLSRPTFYRRKRVALSGFVSAVARRASAQPCPDRVDSLLAAAGGSGFAAARRTREHAAECAQCAATLRHLTAARHGLAVLAPLPALAPVVGDRVADRVGLVVDAGLDWLRAIAVRAPDPAAALPVSKGAATALAAACVGVGGTATCALVGVPAPVRDSLGLHREPTREATRAPRRSPAAPVIAPVARTSATREDPRVTAARAAKRTRRVKAVAATGGAHEFTARKPRRGVAEAEFRSPAPAASTAAVEAAPATTPAPAPPAAGGEFGGGSTGRTSSEFGG